MYAPGKVDPNGGKLLIEVPGEPEGRPTLLVLLLILTGDDDGKVPEALKH